MVSFNHSFKIVTIIIHHINCRQIKLYCTRNGVHARIHQVGASCDFRVKFAFETFGPFIEYDGEKLDKSWIRLHDFVNPLYVNIFVSILLF